MVLIGVILGFILNSIKDYFQNRPRIKTGINEKSGKFNYFKSTPDGAGGYIVTRSEPYQANFLSLSLKIDVYNIGKSDTSIKSMIIVASSKGELIGCNPKLEINGIVNNNYSFNVISGNITTLDISLELGNDEDHCFLFDENISLLPDEKGHLLFTLILTDIYNKEHKVKIEPLAFLTA